MAKRIPGKEEFHETLRYFGRRIEIDRRAPRARPRASRPDELAAGGYDEVVLATGVTPRDPRIEGEDEFRAAGKVHLLRGPAAARQARPASASRSIGAGGIGFDVSEYLVSEGHSTTLDTAAWLREWGVADPAVARGGLGQPRDHAAARGRSTCCSARPRRSARASARPRAGSTARSSR